MPKTVEQMQSQVLHTHGEFPLVQPVKCRFVPPPLLFCQSSDDGKKTPGEKERKKRETRGASFPFYVTNKEINKSL